MVVFDTNIFFYARFREDFQVTSYKLQVTSYELLIYCTIYELLFTYQLRMITFCTSNELIFTYELRVNVYCTSYEMIFTSELPVTIYWTSCDCNVDCVNQVFLANYSWATYFMNECSNVKLQSAILSCVKFLC